MQPKLTAQLRSPGAKAIVLEGDRRHLVRRRDPRVSFFQPRVPLGTAAQTYRVTLCAALQGRTRCTAGPKLTVRQRPEPDHPCTCVQPDPGATANDGAASEPQAGS